MASFVFSGMHANDLCRSRQIISVRPSWHKKKNIMSGIIFPHWLIILRSNNGKERKKKKPSCPFVSAIDSACVKKHNRVKSALKSGEDPKASVPFSPAQTQKGTYCLLASPTPTVGSVHYSWCKLKQGKVCDDEVEDMEMCHSDTMNKCVCVCFPCPVFTLLPEQRWQQKRQIKSNNCIVVLQSYLNTACKLF